jgi:hypothetical protein
VAKKQAKPQANNPRGDYQVGAYLDPKEGDELFDDPEAALEWCEQASRVDHGGVYAVWKIRGKVKLLRVYIGGNAFVEAA